MAGSPGGMEPYRKLSVGLCYWQTGPSAVALSMSTLVKEGPYCCNPYFISTAMASVHGPIEYVLGWLGRRVLTSIEWVICLPYYFESPPKCLSLDRHSQGKNIFADCAHLERSDHIPLPVSCVCHRNSLHQEMFFPALLRYDWQNCKICEVYSVMI